jgi:hypothetical protein
MSFVSEGLQTKSWSAGDAYDKIKKAFAEHLSGAETCDPPLG